MQYDALTTRYALHCPVHGDAKVMLHDFRALERLPGASHPALFRVRVACRCGGRHDGLVSHDELDWAPLGLREQPYVNLMTSRVEDLAGELGDLAARRIRAGEWPWTFYCAAESRARPVFPSSFFVLQPTDDAIAVAVRCPACGRISVNLVSPEHVDVPFHTDAQVGVVHRRFALQALADPDRLAEELEGAPVTARRL